MEKQKLKKKYPQVSDFKELKYRPKDDFRTLQQNIYQPYQLYFSNRFIIGQALIYKPTNYSLNNPQYVRLTRKNKQTRLMTPQKSISFVLKANDIKDNDKIISNQRTKIYNFDQYKNESQDPIYIRQINASQNVMKNKLNNQTTQLRSFLSCKKNQKESGKYNSYTPSFSFKKKYNYNAIIHYNKFSGNFRKNI